MIRIRLYLILCLSLIGFSLCRGQSVAEQAARDFLALSKVSPGVKSLSGFDKTGRVGNIRIFERHNPDCFVLVKESDTLQIVGYSLQNRIYQGDSLNSTVQTFLEALSSVRQLDFLDHPLKTSYNPAGPFLQTRWSQGEFFNFYCPEDDQAVDGHAYVGCAAVAMGQILRYYGKFNDFLFQATSQHQQYGELNATVGNFDWMAMENVPVTLDTEVSRLLFGLGVATNMLFGPTASSTSNYMVYQGFKDLKYFDAVRMARATTERQVWIHNFYQDIQDSKPIYVSGSGHSFVCDGIDSTGLFHFNLGWYGYGDGYYPLDLVMIINPSEAIFRVAPYNTLFSPVKLILDTTGGADVYRWSDHPLSTETPIGYRVYMNDTLFFEIQDQFISRAMFPPGNHRIMVSSLYTGGESRWVGPIELTVPGPRVVFEDPVVEQIVLDELRRVDSSSLVIPTSEKILTISQIEISQPVSSLKGLESCKNLQVLKISGSGQSLDFTPVSSLKRLKSLSIKDITPVNIDLVGRNDRLFELSLERTPLPDISFICSLKNLIYLHIRDVQVSDPAILTDLSLLEKLTLSNCGITQAEFVESFPHLKSLDLSDNSITRIRWNVNNYHLLDLNLSNNLLSDLFFLDKLKVIRSFNVNRNQLERFVTGQIFSNLVYLDLSHNHIDSLFLTYPAQKLSKLSIRGNHIRTITGLKNFAPGLTWFDASGNDLQELWSGCLQQLSYLDISKNKVIHLLPVTNHPLLTHLACDSNRITDLYPLATREFYRQLNFLSMTVNPLTTESQDVFIPRIRGGIDTLYVPPGAERMSPGYPVPERGGMVSGYQAELAWETSGSPAIVRYELLTGDAPDELRIRYADLQEQRCTIDVYPGRTYYWAVRSVTADTSFMSGIFNFNTFTPVTLPLADQFETYPVFSYIPEVSTGWVNPYISGTLIKDGRIIGFKKYEGRYALSIGTESGLILPMDHLAQKNLSIRQQILIESGKKACFRIKSINGSDLDIYFKSSGRCDIIFNQLFIKEIDYPRDQWIPFEVYAWGGVCKIKITIGNKDVELPWLFPTGIVHVKEIEYSGSSGPYYPQDGFPLYYIDNLSISASGYVSVPTEPLRVDPVIYPNPADSYLDIVIPAGISDPKPVLFDNSGRQIDPVYSHQESGRIRITTSGLKSGVYYLDLLNDPEFKAVRILIIH